MKLFQLRTFLAVYHEGSFTGAAHAIHATQSGVSTHIRELEKALDVRLFDRAPGGVVATTAGKRFHGHAREIMRRVGEAREDMAAFAGKLTGAVRAGLMPTFTRSALAPALERFAALHPYVDVTVAEHFSGALVDLLASGDLDFAILPAGQHAPGLHAEHVASDMELFVTRADAGSPHLAPVRLVDVAPLKLIAPSPGNARRASLDAYLRRNEVRVAALLEMDSMLGALDLIASSDWTAVLPLTLCAADFAGRERWLHPLVDPSLSLDLALFTGETVTLSTAARELAEELIAAAADIRRRWDALPRAGPTAV